MSTRPGGSKEATRTPGQWYEYPLDSSWTVHGLLSKSGKTSIEIQPRPAYCDRGNYHTTIETTETHIDGADGFPRYYFDLAVAKSETEAFLKKRGLL